MNMKMKWMYDWRQEQLKRSTWEINKNVKKLRILPHFCMCRPPTSPSINAFIFTCNRRLLCPFHHERSPISLSLPSSLSLSLSHWAAMRTTADVDVVLLSRLNIIIWRMRDEMEYRIVYFIRRGFEFVKVRIRVRPRKWIVTDLGPILSID